MPPASCHPPPALPPGAVRRLDTATRPLVWSSARQTRHRVYGRAERHAVTHDELYRLLLGPVPRLTRPTPCRQPPVSQRSVEILHPPTRRPRGPRRSRGESIDSTLNLQRGLSRDPYRSKDPRRADSRHLVQQFATRTHSPSDLAALLVPQSASAHQQQERETKTRSQLHPGPQPSQPARLPSASSPRPWLLRLVSAVVMACKSKSANRSRRVPSSVCRRGGQL